MNIAKNMEVIFIVALSLASVTTFATASRGSDTPAPVRATASAERAVPMVVVSARRLTAAEKAAAQ